MAAPVRNILDTPSYWSSVANYIFLCARVFNFKANVTNETNWGRSTAHTECTTNRTATECFTLLHGVYVEGRRGTNNIPQGYFLTLSLLMSYIYGAPSKATNLTSYIYGRDFFTGDFPSWTVHFIKLCVKHQQIHQLFIQFINYVLYLLQVSVLHCHSQGAFLVGSERCSIEEQSIEYCGWACACACDHVTRHNTPIHNILSTASQFSISQKALGMLPEDGNIMSKHVGATIHN
jgi:hypothetical protein